MSSAKFLDPQPVAGYGREPVPAPPLDYQPGDQPVPGYTLIRRLGGGSMGIVWLARNQQGFELALKVVGLTSSGGRREWRGLAVVRQRRIHHGNLLRLYDYWLKDREGNLVPDTCEPLAGSSVSAVISSRRAQTVSTARGNLDSTLGRRTLGGPKADDAAPPGSQPPAAQPAQLLLAMDLGDGTLNDVRQKHQAASGGGVPVEVLIRYLRQAASGLDYLHRAGLVHRDVKPHNIILVGNVATIADYGLAIASDIDVKATSNAFSAAYASPEAVAWRDGSPPLTGQADQYSLAITYYELRTGRLPFFQETLTSIYTAKETGKYDLSAIENKAVRAVLKRALARSPRDRYTTCGELVRELDRAEHSSGAAQAALLLAAALIVMLVSALAVYPIARGRLERGAEPRQEREVARQDPPSPAEDDADRGPDDRLRLIAFDREPAVDEHSPPHVSANSARHASDGRRRESPPGQVRMTIHRFFVSPPLPADALPAGETLPASREPTAAELVNLAEAQLTPDEADDLLGIFEINSARAIAASEHLSAARQQRGDDAYLQGLEAIALAIPAAGSAAAADWPQIAKLADRALALWNSSAAARQSQRRDAVEYVRALATTHLADAPAEQRMAAVRTLALLLDRYFDSEERATDRDAEIYERLVLPALSIPWDGVSTDAAVRPALAQFRAAETRLLARHPEGLLVRPAKQE
jgi:serine/threonine protein kinase